MLDYIYLHTYTHIIITYIFSHFKSLRTRKMTPWVKELVQKAWQPQFDSGAQIKLEGQNQLHKTLPSDLHKHSVVHMPHHSCFHHEDTHTANKQNLKDINNKNKKKCLSPVPQNPEGTCPPESKASSSSALQHHNSKYLRTYIGLTPQVSSPIPVHWYPNHQWVRILALKVKATSLTPQHPPSQGLSAMWCFVPSL